MSTPTRILFKPGLVLTIGLAACMAAAFPASAQTVAVVVNGQPILSSEIASRAGLLKLTGGNPSTAKQDLIDEKIKLAEAARYKITPNKEQVDGAFASIAQRAKLTPDQFSKALSQRGVNPQTLKDRLGAEIVWSQVVRGKFASRLQAKERETLANMAQQRGGALSNKATQYTLKQVIFVLPKGASPAQVNQRHSEAVAARGRFPGCDKAVAFARALHDVAVKDTVTRSTGQLGKDMSDLLAKTKVGGLTEPQRSNDGFEMIAVCNRKDIADDSVLSQAVDDQQGAKQAQEQSDKYLAQLKSRAVIQDLR